MRNVRTTLERLWAPAREKARETVHAAVRDAGSPAGPPPRLSGRARRFDVLLALALGVTTVYYGIDNANNVVVREIAPGVEYIVRRPSGTGGMAFMVTVPTQ